LQFIQKAVNILNQESIMNSPSQLIASALFVDFDNIYISLDRSDPRAAEEFASNPAHWLNWLENKLSTEHFPAENVQRRILIRKVYVNPDSFREYRFAFVRAAFDVIDCPPLTTQNKTAADIHMVIDILEALAHPTHFEEFIILSGDADFTPVLVKLREHGRYSTVLSLSSAAAFKSASDLALTSDKFVQKALGITEEQHKPAPQPSMPKNQSAPKPAPEPKEAVDKALLEKMAARLYQLAGTPGGIPANSLTDIYKGFPEFKNAEPKWFGFQGLRGLTEALANVNSKLKTVGSAQVWRVQRTDIEPETEPATTPVLLSEDVQRNGVVRDAIARWIQTTVPHAPSAVPLPPLSEAVLKRFGDRLAGTDWLGAGSFKQMLLDMELSPLRLSANGDGYIYLPGKHQPPAA
jgi:uncharacterized LabA/DUF88 family protein